MVIPGEIVRALGPALPLLERRRCRPRLTSISQRAELGNCLGVRAVFDIVQKSYVASLVSSLPPPKTLNVLYGTSLDNTALGLKEANTAESPCMKQRIFLMDLEINHCSTNLGLALVLGL